MIELHNVTKCFATRTAVAGLDLAVPRGAIYGLLGHNGAGKSTTIGLMLGQVWPTAGQIRLNGFDVIRDRKRALARVGAIFETPAFYDYLTGRQNLEVFCGYSGPVSPDRVREVVQRVGLTGREQAKVRTYSHGMRTRLALAQALLPDPELLVLDEPSDGLDPEGIHEMRETILRLNRELGLTILLSSHLLNEVEQLCSRICVLHEGRKVFDGGLDAIQKFHQQVRLVVNDFPAVTRLLLSNGLITATSGDTDVLLAEGVGTEQIAKAVVEAGYELHELAREEQTLERFYLELVTKARSVEPTGASNGGSAS